MKNVLILRPIPQAYELAEQLRQFNVSVVFEPLFKIHHLSLPCFDGNDVQALIATSQHAIHSLKDFPLKTIPLYTVGDKTAVVGVKMGFKNIISAGGTVKDLMNLLTKHRLSPDKRIIYFSGDIIKKDIAESLQQQGLWAEKIICYHTEATVKLSDGLLSQLKQNAIQVIIFLSGRNVDVFTRLIRDLEDISWQENIECVCLSRSIAEVAEGWGWKKIWFSSKPNSASLLRYFS